MKHENPRTMDVCTGFSGEPRTKQHWFLIAGLFLSGVGCKNQSSAHGLSGVAGQVGTVTNLAIDSTSPDSVTLRFTEVDDGTGQPAQYDLRFASPTIVWESAASATSGSCAIPMAGVQPGSARTCTVNGLSPSTAYQFQLVPFRGTLHLNAVFGGLSNIVDATTLAATSSSNPGGIGAVGDLKVVSADTNSVTLSFTEVDNGLGQAASYDVRFAPNPIQWGSATSATMGSCALPVAGTQLGAVRTCTVAGLSSGMAYQFQLVPFAGTLNLNAVFGTLSNIVDATTLGGGGNDLGCSKPGVFYCNDFENGLGNFGSWGWSVSTTEHYLGSQSLGIFYPSTYPSASAPRDNGGAGFSEYVFPTPTNEFHVRWYEKFSANFKWSPIATKGFMVGEGQAGNWDRVLYLDNDAGGGGWRQTEPEESKGAAPNQFFDNRGGFLWMGANLGPWVEVEAHLKLNTPGQPDGVYRQWVNGILVREYTNINWGSRANFGYFEISAYWNCLNSDCNTNNAPGQGNYHENMNRYIDNLVLANGDVMIGPAF